MGIPKETQNALHVRKSYRTNSNGLVASFQHLIKGTTCSCTSPCTRPRVFLLAFLETNPCPTLYSTETINGSRYCMFPGLCVGGEKRAWYTLFAHAQFSQSFWEFGNSRKICSVTLTSMRLATFVLHV